MQLKRLTLVVLFCRTWPPGSVQKKPPAEDAPLFISTLSQSSRAVFPTFFSTQSALWGFRGFADFPFYRFSSFEPMLLLVLHQQTSAKKTCWKCWKPPGEAGSAHSFKNSLCVAVLVKSVVQLQLFISSESFQFLLRRGFSYWLTPVPCFLVFLTPTFVGFCRWEDLEP